MISAKKLIKLAKRWQQMASIRRKRITIPRTTADAETNSCSTSSVVDKGHFVVYSVDHKRFVLPLEYLKNNIVMELFNLAEEEFGLPSNGILLMPCDANFMEYVIALIKKKPSKEVEKALILSASTSRCCSTYLYQQEMNPQSKFTCTLEKLKERPRCPQSQGLFHIGKLDHLATQKGQCPLYIQTPCIDRENKWDDKRMMYFLPSHGCASFKSSFRTPRKRLYPWISDMKVTRLGLNRDKIQVAICLRELQKRRLAWPLRKDDTHKSRNGIGDGLISEFVELASGFFIIEGPNGAG
ncbi:hypothetical protein GQ457_18G018770 [Hibiscus cannabinus]